MGGSEQSLTGHPVESAQDSVERVVRCVLEARDLPWRYAEQHAAEIDTFWSERGAAQSGLFNGTIYMLETQLLAVGEFRALLKPVEFKSFYYWRARGFPEAGIRDSFGSALIRSAEGHVLLGRQRAGNLNAGLSYLPGGFIDPRDVDPTGRIDISASILREATEETGLDATDLAVVPGFLLTRCGHQISIGVEFRSPLDSSALAQKVRAFLGRDADAELSEVDIVRSTADLAGLAVPAYAGVLLRWLFAGPAEP